MVQVVDLTDCTRGNLTCSIKEGRKQSHPRKSAEMFFQWKRNSPEKPNAGSWTRGWMKSPEKDTTSSAVMCATPPYWSDPFRILTNSFDNKLGFHQRSGQCSVKFLGQRNISDFVIIVGFPNGEHM